MTKSKKVGKKYTLTQEFNFSFIRYKGMEFLIEVNTGDCIQSNGKCMDSWYNPFNEMTNRLGMHGNAKAEKYFETICVEPLVFEIEGGQDHQAYTDYLLDLMKGELYKKITEDFNYDYEKVTIDPFTRGYMCGAPVTLGPLFALLEYEDLIRVIDECSNDKCLINYVAHSTLLCMHKDWEPIFSKLIHNKTIDPVTRANIIDSYGWDTNFDWSEILAEDNAILTRAVLSFNCSDPTNRKYFKKENDSIEGPFISDSHMAIASIVGGGMSTPSFRDVLEFIKTSNEPNRSMISFKYNIGLSDRIRFFNPNGIIDELFK